MDAEKEGKKHGGHNYDYIKAYQWVKGQSGNPKGRPKGKTLKTFAREFLESLPDEQKLEYLATLPSEIVWRMAEGNPEQGISADVKATYKPLANVSKDYRVRQNRGNEQANTDSPGGNVGQQDGIDNLISDIISA